MRAGNGRRVVSIDTGNSNTDNAHLRIGGPDRAGKISVTDVTAAILQVMVEIYEHIAVKRENGVTVYFHLNYEGENIKIHSVRAKKATVTIHAKRKDDLRIRVPRWTPPR